MDTSDFKPEKVIRVKQKNVSIGKGEIDAYWERDYELPADEKKMVVAAIEGVKKNPSELEKQVSGIIEKGNIVDFEGEVF